MKLSRTGDSGWRGQQGPHSESISVCLRNIKEASVAGADGDGQGPTTEARPCRALEATGKILAFILNDAESHGRFLSRNVTYFI